MLLMPKLIIAGLLAIMIAFSAQAAHDGEAAQQPCAPMPALEQMLSEQFGETIQFYGLRSDSTLMLMFANIESGTWTLVAMTPQQIGCILTDGENYRVYEELKGRES